MRLLPTKQELVEIVDKLISGEISRKQASLWAFAISDDDEIELNDGDDIVWDVLENLVLSDAISTDRPYLYGVEDFMLWRAKLE